MGKREPKEKWGEMGRRKQVNQESKQGKPTWLNRKEERGEGKQSPWAGEVQ